MQNQVYSRYLFQMLLEYGSVSVPTLGTFGLKYVEASFNDNRTLIQPPFTKIDFDATADKQNNIAELLFETGMSKEDAHLIQQLIIDDYAVSKGKNIPFEIPLFGMIVNHHFIEKDDKVFNKYEGLDPINVKALAMDINRHIEFGNSEHSTTFKPIFEKKETPLLVKYWFPILVTILALMSLLLLGNHLRSDKTTKLISPTERTIGSEDTGVHQGSGPEINNSVGGINEDSIVDAVSDSLISTKEFDTLHFDQDTPSCVVIVGSFKNESNALRLLSKISDKGYGTYTGLANGYKRVGISYNCETNDPQEFKTMIRNEFNQKAWDLSDTLHN